MKRLKKITEKWFELYKIYFIRNFDNFKKNFSEIVFHLAF